VPENVPFHEPPAGGFPERKILGNHVILALGHGRFAAYGHPQTGSVRVRVGQWVRRGQVLARVGNTRPSGGPHLHFQVTDGQDPVASERLPFVFRRLQACRRGHEHRPVPHRRGERRHPARYPRWTPAG
jgi:murein DD-endopeptidase MepM/ murein hydrolase activator NlpD